MRAAENDFEGYSDDNSTGKGREGAFVRVHAGRGQATFCAGAHRKWSGSLHQRAGAAHAQDADGRWSRRCEDGGTRKRCEDGGVRRIIGSKQGRTIWGSMDTVAASMMEAGAAGNAAGT